MKATHFPVPFLEVVEVSQDNLTSPTHGTIFESMQFRKTHLEIWRQKRAIEPYHMRRINVKSQEHCHTLAEKIDVSMGCAETCAPELIVAEEVKGHQRLDVLDPSALVIQGFITDICHSHSLDTIINFSLSNQIGLPVQTVCP